jgi:type IV secretory pathway VirB2 component (pilin)
MHEPLNMTEGVTQPISQPMSQPMSQASAEQGPAGAPRKPSMLRVLRDQKKTIAVAVVMVVATYWIAGQFGEWELAGCISGGVLLGLANHLMTERWLLGIITSGAQPTRSQMIASTLTRLGVLTVVAVGAAIAFWPNGIGLLLGLAIFRLIALVMTGLPLLKELKQG